jgi:L-lactate dehydrogenase complex protein LldG
MVSGDLVGRFVSGALAAGAEVIRVTGMRQAFEEAARLVGEVGPATVNASRAVRKDLAAAGVEIVLPDSAGDIAAAAVSVVQADFGAAETGTLVHFDTDDEERLIWTLPPFCIAVLEARTIFPDLESLSQEIAAHLGRNGTPGPQVSLVTGPSRTADIESQLTIGVQGPARLVIIIVEDGKAPAP